MFVVDENERLTPDISACFGGTVVFTNNAIPYAATGAGGEWGKGNFLLSDQNAVGYQSIPEQDYRLSTHSRYTKKGTDGKDLGADIDAINAAISGAN